MNDLATLFGGHAFDPATVEPQADFEVIPPGKYPVLIEAAQVKQTKAGTGHFIELTMSILDGPHKNRKVWDKINIDNPSTQCVEIGLRTLSALGRAIGLQAISDTTQLVNQVVVAHVKVKNERNEVRTFSRSDSYVQGHPTCASQPSQTQASTAPAVEGASTRPPWERNGKET